MKYYMDEATFKQVGGEDFEGFLKENLTVYKYPFDEKEQLNNQKENNLNNQNICRSTEDFNNFLQITWLELYLPRFELQYGMFEYSKSDLSDSEKIEELLGYYANNCGIENISEIPKKSFGAFKRHR